MARSGYLLRKVEENHYEVEQAGEPVMEFDFSAEQDVAPLHRLRLGEQTITFRHKVGHLREIRDFEGAGDSRRELTERGASWVCS